MNHSSTIQINIDDSVASFSDLEPRKDTVTIPTNDENIKKIHIKKKKTVKFSHVSIVNCFFPLDLISDKKSTEIMTNSYVSIIPTKEIDGGSFVRDVYEKLVLYYILCDLKKIDFDLPAENLNMRLVCTLTSIIVNQMLIDIDTFKKIVIKIKLLVNDLIERLNLFESTIIYKSGGGRNIYIKNSIIDNIYYLGFVLELFCSKNFIKEETPIDILDIITKEFEE